MSDIDSEEKLEFGLGDLDSLLDDESKRIENMAHSENKITGPPNGFRNLDRIIFGFQKSSLIVVGGRPSMMLHRPAAYGEDVAEIELGPGKDKNDLTELLVSKKTTGESGMVWLRISRSHIGFEEWEKPPGC